jgi:hypothetical protein
MPTTAMIAKSAGRILRVSISTSETDYEPA